MKKIFYLAGFILLILNLNAQSFEKIDAFLSENINFILESAHKNSTLISFETTVEEDESGEADTKAVITIHYKGFIKNHKLKCIVYFEDFPVKFVWGTDSNAFEINTEKDAMLEELKIRWSAFKFED